MNSTEDVVDRAFRHVREHVTGAAFAPHVAEITARGRRRRAAQVVAAAAAVLAVVVAGSTVAGVHLADSRPNPAATVPPDGTATPSPPLSGGRGEETRAIPAGFLGGGNADGARVNAACFGHPKLSGTGLYVYVDENAAKQAFSTVRGNVAVCSGYGSQVGLSLDSKPWGDEAGAATVPLQADGSGESTGRPVRVAVVRVGPSIAVFADYQKAPGLVDLDAQHAVGPLCLYDPTCARPTGWAAAPTLHNGDTVWAAALYNYRTYADDSTPGTSMALAAGEGFRASIVPVECDRGAAAALKVASTGYRYVVVYFADERDAEHFATAFPELKATAIRVDTYCL